MDLNPGIKNTVAWLQSLGYETTDSGDGKTHDHGCDREYAYVVIRVNPEGLASELRVLRAQVESMGVMVMETMDELSSVELDGMVTLSDGKWIGLIDLRGFDDSMLKAFPS